MTINAQNLERMQIGRALADQLDQRKSPVEVAKMLGISTTRLRQIELIALYKVAQRMKEITGHEMTENETKSIPLAATLNYND